MAREPREAQEGVLVGTSRWVRDFLRVSTRLTDVVWLHDVQIGRGEAETPTLAVRKACEEAVKTAKTQKILETLCTCPKKKRRAAGEA